MRGARAGLEEAREAAARAAVELVEPDMLLGLGTGRTAAKFVRLLGARVRAGLRVTGVATSQGTEEEARREGIPLVPLPADRPLDLTVDGADEVDGKLRLIKGGGGALLREKIVAAASRRVVIVVDGAKLVDTLGAFPLPVEVVRFGWERTAKKLEALGAKVARREARREEPFRTDEGHFILDARFGRIADPESLARVLDGTAGVVEHGLFLGMADTVLVGRAGGIESLRRP